MTLVITSPVFAHNGAIPITYTCETEDVSPPLAWSGVPAGARSLALIVDDPDAPDPAAPERVFVHWVVYDMEPSAGGLSEGVNHSEQPNGGRQGINDGGTVGYMGPCPPIGRHRYYFKLYALDTTFGTTLGDLGPATKADVEAAMRGHVLEQAELMGTYQGEDGPAKRRR
jgi:Raf kinase inhibitor-like YbhB/YbcL family protein